MPPAEPQTDPDLLLRDAISGVAVTAYSRGTNITAHVDNRLPRRAVPRSADLAGFLRRGLLRMIEKGQGGKIALALWLDETAPDGDLRTLLEVCRALNPETAPVSRLADIWTLPLGSAMARPVPARRDMAAESVLIPLDFTPVPGAPAVASRLGGVFRGRRLLHARDVLFDRARLRRSMAAIGLELDFADSPEAALAALLAAVEEGRDFDAVVVEGTGGIETAVGLARQVRAAPELARTRLVLANAARGGVLAAEDTALFDAIARAAAPWRRLLDLMHDMFRTDAGGAEPCAVAASGIGGGTVPMLAGRRILVAEDVATNQLLLQAVLAHTGAAIEVVADGAAVVERHRTEPADLIVMDLQMPGMGGIAALRAIRALGGATGTVPVVALTAYARNTDRRNALAAGMDGYLAKPIIVAEFYDLLRQLLPPGEGR